MSRAIIPPEVLFSDNPEPGPHSSALAAKEGYGTVTGWREKMDPAIAIAALAEKMSEHLSQNGKSTHVLQKMNVPAEEITALLNGIVTDYLEQRTRGVELQTVAKNHIDPFTEKLFADKTATLDTDAFARNLMVDVAKAYGASTETARIRSS